jgi:putative oxidoreductase
VSGRRAREWLGHPALGAICRLLLGGVFIYASLPKLLRPDEFARLINGYRVVHPDLTNLAGIALPWVEFAAGVFLAVGVLPQSSALVVAAMLSLFIGAGSLALARGLEIECGCFLPLLGSHKLSWDLLVRDAVLLLMAAQVLVWPSSFLPRRRRG